MGTLGCKAAAEEHLALSRNWYLLIVVDLFIVFEEFQVSLVSWSLVQCTGSSCQVLSGL